MNEENQKRDDSSNKVNQQEPSQSSNKQFPIKSEPSYPSSSSVDQFRRHIAYKFQIGSILQGKPFLENDRLRFIEINNKHIFRVNIIANIVDKFIQEGEKKFASLTIDDGSGQIKIKTFGDDIIKVQKYSQGDTILIIGLLRYWNNEVYLTPDIIKKKDIQFLLARKLEIEATQPKEIDKQSLSLLKNKIISIIKQNDEKGGVEIDSLILELKEHPDIINKEIKRLLEDGLAYEPRPGKLRYLGSDI